jgi:hypothetical protein
MKLNASIEPSRWQRRQADLGVGDGAPGGEAVASGAHGNQHERVEWEEDDAGVRLDAAGARTRARAKVDQGGHKRRQSE